MGLTLHYALRMPADTPAARIHELLENLRDAALDQPFDHVSDFLTNVDTGNPWQGVLDIWTDIIANPWDENQRPLYGRLDTLRAFYVVPGDGSEPAPFGFFLRDDASGSPAEWYWSGFCKTQYASTVSEEHFVKCHTMLIAMLDRAVALGIEVEVHDEGGYWETRDPERLLAEVRKMNVILARFAGALSDRLGDEHSVKAEIFAHPEFEHLEMEKVELGGVKEQ